MLDMGQHPRLGLELVQETQLEALNEFTNHMDAATKEAQYALKKQQMIWHTSMMFIGRQLWLIK